MRIKEILAPTDFSPDAAAAGRLAVELAQRFDASITLLHVYQLPVYVTPDGGVLQPTAAHLARQAQRIDDELESARQSLEGARVPIKAISAAGDPAHEIVAAATGFDLVVMGTRGRAGLLHLLVLEIFEAAAPNRTARMAAHSAGIVLGHHFDPVVGQT